MSLKKWFGEKWVDISTKKDGKHPKCGRTMGDGRKYPKCVPSSKAARMTVAEKRKVSAATLLREEWDTDTAENS